MKYYTSNRKQNRMTMGKFPRHILLINFVTKLEGVNKISEISELLN